MAAAATRRAAFAEESAEVEVLFANLEKLNGLAKKIQGSVNRLETSGRDLQKAMKPIQGSTKKISQVHSNVDKVATVVTKFQAPLEQRDQEESIIRADPRRVGIEKYVASLQRSDQAVRSMGNTNLGANQAALKETTALVKYGVRQLEEIFKHTLLSTGASGQVEPLAYIAKEKLFPIIPREETPALKAINQYMANAPGMSTSMVSSVELYSTAKIFAEVRGTYVARSLTNMAAATLSTARARNPDSFYKKGDCSIGSYKIALHGMLAAEYDNIRILFAPEESTKMMIATAGPALRDFGKTMSDLNNMISENLMRDCFLAYETMDIVTKMGGQLGDMAGLEIQKPIRELLRPVHNTAKSSIGKMLEHTKTTVQRLGSLPQEGAAIPATMDAMERLRAMGDFLPPVLKVITAVGDGNWGPIPGSPNGTNSSPSLRSFDTTLTGTTAGTSNNDSRQIFIHFCADILETLVAALDSRSRLLLKTQAVQPVFMLNNVAVIEGMIRSHDILGDLLLGPTAVGSNGQSIQSRLDVWRSKWTKIYLQNWQAASMHLLDVQYTSRGSGSRRSGQAMNKDSEAIVAAMPSKEREATKEKFRLFNVTFDDLVQKHRTYRMERDVKAYVSKEVAQMIEPLYGRFWDRYHEVDRKGKYVKYDKVTLSQVLAQLG